MTTPRRIVGRRVPRLDAVEKATGSTRYVADLKLPGLLHARLVTSPHPHARIRRIDTSRAEALPGVVAVATHRDVPDLRWGELVQDQRVFAKEKVTWVGDPVAIVAAVDVETATRAAGLVEVDYEPIPAVFDPEAALRDEAPTINEGWESFAVLPPFAAAYAEIRGRNVAWRQRIEKGDVEQAFRGAHVVLEETYEIPMGQPAPIETHAVLAQADAGGKLTIWTNIQIPFAAREVVAHALLLPMSKVRVIVPPIGGAFGAKCQVWLEPHVAALALKARRPVRLVLTREEEMTLCQPRHPAVIRIATAVGRDGRLLARRARTVFNTGATTMLAPIQAGWGSFTVIGPYAIPNLDVDVACVHTNTASSGLVRGPSGPQSCFAVESHMDELAKRLGLDPLEFRLRNILTEGSEAPTGHRLTSVGLREALERAARGIGWGDRPKGTNRGKGLAIAFWSTLTGQGSGAVVQVNEDGSVSLHTGAVDHGTGSASAGLAQIIAEELQVPYETISIVHSDTETTPFDFGGVGSRTTFNQGQAVRLAVADAKRQLAQVAASQLGTTPEELELVEGLFRLAGDPARRVPLTLCAALAPYTVGPVVGRGTYNGTPPAPSPDVRFTGAFHRSLNAPSFGAQAVEVEVDPETGQVRVLKVAAALDVGYAINPLGIEGQIVGGVVQGLGIALTERSVLEEGRIRNASFLDFKLPLAPDVPPIEVHVVESARNLPAGSEPAIYGAKGVGEPPVIPTAAAVANAVADATGVRHHALPLLPERVWRAKGTPDAA